jgi:hypothetical protein
VPGCDRQRSFVSTWARQWLLLLLIVNCIGAVHFIAQLRSRALRCVAHTCAMLQVCGKWPLLFWLRWEVLVLGVEWGGEQLQQE